MMLGYQAIFPSYGETALSGLANSYRLANNLPSAPHSHADQPMFPTPSFLQLSVTGHTDMSPALTHPRAWSWTTREHLYTPREVTDIPALALKFAQVSLPCLTHSLVRKPQHRLWTLLSPVPSVSRLTLAFPSGPAWYKVPLPWGVLCIKLFFSDIVPMSVILPCLKMKT